MFPSVWSFFQPHSFTSIVPWLTSALFAVNNLVFLVLSYTLFWNSEKELRRSCHSVTLYTVIRAVSCRIMSQCHCMYVDSCSGLQSCHSVIVLFLLVLWFCCCRERPSSTEILVSNLRRHTHDPDCRVSLFVSLHTRKFYNINLLFFFPATEYSCEV
jgi:hypothetical protein